MEDDLRKRLKFKAKEKGMSVSAFVNKVLRERFSDTWPEGYFDLFGAVKDDTFDVPEELPWSLDAPREKWPEE
jgi:hypothetical protein